MIVNFIEVSQNPPEFSSSRFRVVKNALELHGNRRERDSASFFIGYVDLLMIFGFFTLFFLVPTASWGPEHEDLEVLGIPDFSQDLKS